MNVRDLTIELRPRSGWEAVDLGHALARQHYRSLLGIGFRGFGVPLLVLAALCWAVPWLLPILIWYFKPVLDRFYLYYLSRRIFGQTVSARETRGEWKRLLFKGTVPLLTWRRFSPFRAMTMPVTDLEGLTGRERAQRSPVVTRLGGGLATLIWVGGLLLEVIAFASIMALAAFFIPQGQDPNWYEFTSWFREGTIGPAILSLCSGVVYGVVVLLLEPYYVAGGFALYLNSRTSQEAWDVELRFRELAMRAGSRASSESSRRGRQAVSGVLLVALLLLLGSGEKAVAAPAKEPQEVIAEVLRNEDFKNHTRTTKEWVPDDGDPLDRFFDWLGNLWGGGSASGSSGAAGGAAEGFFLLLKVLALALLVAVVGIVIYYIVRNYRGPREGRVKEKFRRPPPQVVMGMAVTPESLPADLLGQAKNCWREGNGRAALSLLYRGALMQLITGQEIAIEASDTESECERRVRTGAPEVMANYFSLLSQGWMRVAYSTLPVSDQEFETLCTQWPFHNSRKSAK